MTDSTTHPKPKGLEIDLLHDAVWDLRDYGKAFLFGEDNAEKWDWWLRRYEGLAEGEFEIKTHARYLLILRKD